jgi:hypothetical protein
VEHGRWSLVRRFCGGYVPPVGCCFHPLHVIDMERI